MSCDFGILSLGERLSDQQVGELYVALCEGDSTGVVPNTAVDDFYEQLTSRHPEIDDVAEEYLDDIDLCPWSIAFDRSPGHLIISCVWPKANYVQELLSQLAADHQLAIYDPQSETVTYPDGSSGQPEPWWKFW